MVESPRWIIRLCALIIALLVCVAGAAYAQPPFYRIGAPYPPVRDPRLTTDNGIPGSGSYYYLDYPWPSLRQAIQEYGLFGRRFKKRIHTEVRDRRLDR